MVAINRIQQLARGVRSVTHGLAQRQDIQVYLDGKPCTDGKKVFLGPLDPENPQAVTTAIGHACHEVNHILFTDFEAVKTMPEIFPLINLIEDIRVDRAGFDRSPGTFLFREDLYRVLLDRGLAPLPTSEANAEKKLCLALYWNLIADCIGYAVPAIPAQQARAVFCADYGEALFTELFSLAKLGALSGSTQDVVGYARKIAERFAEIQYPTDPSKNYAGDTPEQKHRSAKRSQMRRIRDGFSQVGSIDVGEQCEKFLEQCRYADRQADANPHLSDRYQIWPVEKTEMKAQNNPHFVRDARQLWGSYAARIRRFLQSEAFDSNALGRSGTVCDYRALSQLAYGESRIFHKERRVQKPAVACAVLLDRSGSMDNATLSCAKACAYALCELFDSMEGCESACYGFPGIRRHTLLQIKQFTDNIRHSTPRFSNVTSFGFTPVVQSLQTAAAQLALRNTPRKMIFVITDGLCTDREPIKKAADALAKDGFEILCLSIGTDAAELFTYQKSITGASQMAKAVYELLEKYFQTLKSSGVTAR